MKSLKIQSLIGLVFALLVFASCSKENTPKVTPTPTPSATKSSAKDITKFSFAALSPALAGTIDGTAKTIKATASSGTDATKSVPTITVSDKATVSPASGVAQDFSKEVSYTATGEDGTVQVWKVGVTIEVPDVLNDIALFSADKKIYGYDGETGVKKWEYSSTNNI